MAKKLALSFSRLSTFEQCGRKFEYLYVSKQVQDQGSVHTEYGTRVHEALEKVATGVGDHTEESKPFAALLAKIVARPGKQYYEYQMSVNGDRQPCDWFDSEVWVRSIADVLIVDGEKAWIGDYKTGKVKDDMTQLQLFAAMVFIHFPEVQTVTTSYIWLLKGELTNMTFTRKMLPSIWQALEERFNRVQEAVETGYFQPKPSPLCNWCAAKEICPDRKTR
jgi:CRISPR/Cas system-associated exonuclease Cas4 (RecB family)